MVLGLSQTDLDTVLDKTNRSLTRYEVRVLFDGVIIEKHITVGESIKEDADIFVLADLSTVWVEVTIYAKDLNMVKVGQNVTVRSKVLGLDADGVLEYLGPACRRTNKNREGKGCSAESRGALATWSFCYRRSCPGRGDSTSSSIC